MKLGRTGNPTDSPEKGAFGQNLRSDDESMGQIGKENSSRLKRAIRSLLMMPVD